MLCTNHRKLYLRGKGLVIFREYVSCNLLCCHLIDSLELSSTARSFLSRYHGYHLFVHLFRVVRHSGLPLLQESYFCTGKSVSSINLIELRRDRLSMLSDSQCFLLVLMRFRVKAYCASIFLNKHAVDMFNEFLFSLGDFGKMCLPHPYTKVVFDLLVH